MSVRSSGPAVCTSLDPASRRQGILEMVFLDDRIPKMVNFKLQFNDVSPNINRTQATERAENAVFVPVDLNF